MSDQIDQKPVSSTQPISEKTSEESHSEIPSSETSTTEAAESRIKKILHILKSIVQQIIKGFKALFSFTSSFTKKPKQAFLFLISLLIIGGLIGFTWTNKKNLIFRKLFLNSFAELADQVHDYNPLIDTVVFYDNPKFSKNIVTLSKMVVNLKPSQNSGNNPMLVLEINVEGISADAIIELKDREAEFKDLLSRYQEEKTYDQLNSSLGKHLLCEELRDIINSHLTRGQVRKVLLNAFVIKP